MNCRRVNALLSAYIDKELTGFEMLQIGQHLSDCSECSCELNSLLSIKSMLSSLPVSEPDPAWLQSLSATVHDATLPFYDRWLSRLSAADLTFSFNHRKLTSALMLSSVAIFMVSASFDHNVRETQQLAAGGATADYKVNYSPGDAGFREQWLSSASMVQAEMPDVQMRDFPLQNRRMWPASDPIPAFGPRAGFAGGNGARLTMVGFNTISAGYGSR